MAQERRVLLANGQYITIVQTTGNSTGDVMSQSAVTAALNAKSNVGHTHAATDITSGTFGSARIADGAVTTAKVANGAITTTKIQDKSITLAKLGSDVPISTTSYETVRVSGVTDSGTIPFGEKLTIGGIVYEFDGVSVISALIPYGQVYKIKASSSGFFNISYDATFTAGTPSRLITLTYNIMGVGIEATDGYVYTTDDWPSSKTANSIVVAGNGVSFRMALGHESRLQISSRFTDPLENYMTGISASTAARADYNGAGNTAKIMQMQPSTSYAAGYCNAFTFPDGKTKGYLPALGQLNLAYQNKYAITEALNKCGGTAMDTSDYYWSSTFYGRDWQGSMCWSLKWENGGSSPNYYLDQSYSTRPFAAYT